MQLSDFTLFQAVFQVRFAPAYRLWDRAGQFWETFGKQAPGLKVANAEPNQTSFRLNNEYEFAVRLEDASVIAFRPKRQLGEFTSHGEALLRQLVSILDVSEFSRLGLRLIYTKDYPTIGEASKAVATTDRLNQPPRPIFNQSGEPSRQEWSFRWEDSDNGTNVRLNIQNRKYEFKPPLIWDGAQADSKTSIQLVYDVDTYTVGSILATQLSVADWMKERQHIVNRDSDSVLGGTR